MGTIKVAVLGGGLGALSAAYELSKDRQYEITVYQTGWRLGGKCASGRDANRGHRIEEHGLHILFGFYLQAFDVFKGLYQAYSEEGIGNGTPPLGGIDKAFTRQTEIHLMELWPPEPGAGGKWNRWPVKFPDFNKDPWEIEAGYLSSWEIWRSAIRFVASRLRLLAEHDPATQGGVDAPPWKELGENLQEASAGEGHPRGDRQKQIEELLKATLFETQRNAERLDPVEKLRRWVMLANIVAAAVYGMWRERVMTNGYDGIDDYEISDFLIKYGAVERYVKKKHGGQDVYGPVMKSIYDVAFAFEEGNTSTPNWAAGSCLNSILSMTFGYRGAFMYRMQAGMADIIFTPFYEVLKKRNVRFEFFHKVTNLETSGGEITRIHLHRQVTLRTGVTAYEPLVEVDGLRCWPSAPDFGQLVEGDDLLTGIGTKNYDLESHWTTWPKGRNRKPLELGSDFHAVVLGIPPAELRNVTTELAAASADWRSMLAHVATVRTQAVQLWITDDRAGMGWPTREEPVVDAYEEPLNSWADMSYLCAREKWGSPDVKSIAYLCGPLEEDSSPPPIPNDDYPGDMRKKVLETATSWLTDYGATLWPGIAKNGKFDWDVLYHPDAHATPDQRRGAQYYRANSNPSDRYTQSLRDTTKYRLHPGQSGFSNLFLAGDWTHNVLNAGCVEATVDSGLKCARALQKEFPGVAPSPSPSPSPSLARSLSESRLRGATSTAAATGAKYVVRDGVSVPRPPYRLEDTRLWAWSLRVRKSALQDVCRRYLSQPTGGAWDFRPVFPMVLLSFHEAARLESEVDRDIGWIRERECAFWILAVAGKWWNGIWLPRRAGWFNPHMWVDEQIAMVAGREVFGFPKALAKIELPGIDAVNSFSVTTTVTDASGGDPELQWRELLRVSPPPAAAASPAGAGYRSAAQATTDIFGALLDEYGAEVDASIALDLLLLPQLRLGTNPLFTLKQFRQSAGDEAAVQEIVAAESQVTKLRGGALLDRADLSIQSFASHDLVRELGLPSAQSRTGFGFYLDFDFRFPAGRTWWP